MMNRRFRRIFERAIEAMSVKGGRDDDADAKANECSSETAGSKVKALLKKWLDAEEKHGDQESQSLVRLRTVTNFCFFWDFLLNSLENSKITENAKIDFFSNFVQVL